VCVRPILTEEAAMAERTGGSLHGCAGLSYRGDLGSQKVSSPFFKNCPVLGTTKLAKIQEQMAPRHSAIVHLLP
jgi:hypothetical protein